MKPVINQLKAAGTKVVPLSALLREPLMNGVFKKPENIGQGAKLINVFDLYGDTTVHLNMVEQLAVTPQELNRFVVTQGDIFFTRSSLKPEGIAWSAYLEECTQEAVFECHLIRARVNEDLCLPGFVSNYARTWLARQYLVARAGVTTMATIDQGAINEMPVILPSRSIQSKLLSQLDTARQQRAQRLADADAQFTGLDDFLLDELKLKVPATPARLTYAVKTKDAITRFDPSYHSPHFVGVLRALEDCPYPKIRLQDLTPEPCGGATPKRSNDSLYMDDGIKFLRILNVTPNEIRLDNLKFITQDVHDGELKRSQLQTNDILMTITGRVGTAAVVPAEILPANINQHIVALRLQSTKCLPDYLSAFLNSSIGLTLSNRSVSGGTRIALDYGAIREILIPIPPLETQERIAQEVQSRRERARALRGEAERDWEAAKARFEAALLGEK